MVVGVMRPHQSRICFGSEAINAAFSNHPLKPSGPISQEIHAELWLLPQFFCKMVLRRVLIAPCDLPLLRPLDRREHVDRTLVCNPKSRSGLPVWSSGSSYSGGSLSGIPP